MAVKYPDILESNNPQEYGIVPAKQVAGHKTVNTLNDLHNIADAILSLSKINTDDDAIGQLWYVISEGKYYQLIDWYNKNNSSGWKECSDANIQEITYVELVNLLNNNKLIPGLNYRITDYQCTTTQENTKSAGHVFDIIVQALSEDTLSEEARAILHEGDTYFADSNLSAWKLWYSLDNNKDRFLWADETNGKGVIFRMIDEKRNDCPYDFKNVLFYKQFNDNTTPDSYYYTFSYVVSNMLYDGSTAEQVKTCYNNKMGEYNSSGVLNLTTNVFRNIQFPNQCYNNTFGNSCSNNTFGYSCYNNTIGNSCHDNTFGNSCSNNTIFSITNRMLNLHGSITKKYITVDPKEQVKVFDLCEQIENIKELNNTITQQNKVITELNSSIVELNKAITQQNTTIDKLTIRVDQLTKRIEILEQGGSGSSAVVEDGILSVNASVADGVLKV